MPLFSGICLLNLSGICLYLVGIPVQELNLVYNSSQEGGTIFNVAYPTVFFVFFII